MGTALVLIHRKPKKWKRRQLRAQLRARDGDLCCWCRKPILFGLQGFTPWNPTIEHIVQRRYGGTLDLSNLRLAHYWCNVRRDLGDFSRRHPREPAP